MYQTIELRGTFFYSFEIVTEELRVGKALATATLAGSDDWILLNAKDNLIRIAVRESIFVE